MYLASERLGLFNVHLYAHMLTICLTTNEWILNGSFPYISLFTAVYCFRFVYAHLPEESSTDQRLELFSSSNLPPTCRRLSRYRLRQ